ncbi:MAG: hypothetical protein R3234_05295 [Thermoanaerobaculia bacterium]|nr:hypothetical protein [Thermoanaerobaculia bacterium]
MRPLVLLSTVFLLSGLATSARALESSGRPGPESSPPGAEGPEDTVEGPTEFREEKQEESEERMEPPDPCEVPSMRDEEWLDRMRRGVYETVCGSARWFDSFFGEQRFDREAQRLHGRLRVRAIHDDFEGFDQDVSLRANVDFPNLDRRVNAFLGREDEEDFFRGRSEEFDLLPEFFRQADEREWLLGFGYSPVGGAREKFDIDGGIEVHFPLEPFVRGRYRRYWVFGDRHLVRFRETVFWRNQKGFGNTTGLEAERILGPEMLVRWGGRGTIDQSTEGVEWETGITLYHALNRDNALAYFLGANGETDADVPLREYGGRITYRRRMFREWFFGEILAGITWPREELYQERDTAFHVGFGFEIQFGNEPPD